MQTFEFSRDLMNTQLVIKIVGDDLKYAESAAHDCFEKVDQLEKLLSMYQYGSDIFMLNSMPVGEVVKITDDTAECLNLAFEANFLSSGTIDVCLGEYFLKAKDDEFFNIEQANQASFEFDLENFAVKKIKEGKIDLGAIGKGFALDTITEKLQDFWGIKNAYLNFGASSIYLMGKNSENENWKVKLSTKDELALENISIGASGTAIQGMHILDARTKKTPENLPFRTWAFCKNSAIADAMSTAFMSLNTQEIKKICEKYEISAAVQKDENSDILFIGKDT